MKIYFLPVQDQQGDLMMDKNHYEHTLALRDAQKIVSNFDVDTKIQMDVESLRVVIKFLCSLDSFLNEKGDVPVTLCVTSDVAPTCMEELLTLRGKGGLHQRLGSFINVQEFLNTDNLMVDLVEVPNELVGDQVEAPDVIMDPKPQDDIQKEFLDAQLDSYPDVADPFDVDLS